MLRLQQLQHFFLLLLIDLRLFICRIFNGINLLINILLERVILFVQRVKLFVQCVVRLIIREVFLRFRKFLFELQTFRLCFTRIVKRQCVNLALQRRNVLILLRDIRIVIFFITNPLKLFFLRVDDFLISVKLVFQSFLLCVGRLLDLVDQVVVISIHLLLLGIV